VLILQDDWPNYNETFPEVVVSQPISINGGSPPANIILQFNPLPYPMNLNPNAVSPWARATYDAILVFRGLVGQDSDAIIVGGYCQEGLPGTYSFWHSRDSFSDPEVAAIGTFLCPEDY
jgi:hypothetical protein